MRWAHGILIRAVIPLALLLLAGCASYDGRGLRPGIDGMAEVRALMGEPAMQWENADGSKQLAYPRGPAGPRTYMVAIDAHGLLQGIENVMEMRHFAKIRPGMDMPSVVRVLGPSIPQWTNYYGARDELVWEWPYCDDSGLLARFDVLFDGTSKTVRTTMSRPDMQGLDGVVPPCGH